MDTTTRLTRRSALKWTGIGLGSAVAGGTVAGGIRAATNGGFTSGRGDPYDLWHDWTTMDGPDRVVAAGVLACNPHNTQPWRIDVDGRTIRVRSDPGRRMPVNDAIHREHFAGLGCAVENMAIAARSAGYAPQVSVFPDDLVARIVLGTGTVSDRTLADAIPHRHTNRGPYEKSPVTLDPMTAEVARVPGTGLVWITEPAARQELGRLYVEATEAIVADDEASAEAFGWFRSSRDDIDEHRDGLTLDGQGLNAATLFVAKVLPAQSRPDGDAFWVKATREVHAATAAAYGVITVPDVTDRAGQVAGGRLLARLHLAATSLGLGFHHMNQITERIDRERTRGGADVFSARWSALIGRPAGTGLVSFRIGHPVRPGGLSPRRALNDVVS